MMKNPPEFRKLSRRSQAAILFTVLVLASGAIINMSTANRGGSTPEVVPRSQPKRDRGNFHPTPSQWSTLTILPVETHEFRAEVLTEGKVAIDEDLVTRVFSPFAGRVTKIFAAPGDVVQRGQLLFVSEAADSVVAQNDFITALTALNKARSHVSLAQVIEHRLSALYKEKAMPLKDWQEAQTNLTAAQNDFRSAQIALEAVRNRLRFLGKTDAEIETFETTGTITPDAPVYAPLSGTILQRKVGPGQYVNAGASDSEPVFLIGDVSKVWLVAYVRESDATKVKLGQTIRFEILACPDRAFAARIDYVATSIDPNSRRLLVRANIDNSEGILKPEMFANVTLVTDEAGPTAAVPREAVIYEGDVSRVWVANDDQAIELRQVKLGLTGGRQVQVLDGLQPGERIITRGNLFIDRMAASSKS